MAGYYHERLAEGAIDPLKAKAIVFRGETEQAALVVCDLIGISIDLSTHIRAEASERTGIPVANVVVSGTHSHTAPDYGKELYRVLGGNPGDPSRAAYIDQLIHHTADAVAAAQANATPSLLFSGSAQQETPVSFNRRFVMKDGSARTWMTYASPDVVRAAGPIDPEIPLLLVKGTDGNPQGLLSSFALHLDTVGGMKWSADYPFYIAESVRAAMGPDVVSVFGLGTCGDINHVDPNASERNKTDFIGNSLGATITNHLDALQPLAATNVRVRSAVVHLPLQVSTNEQLAAAEAAIKAVQKGETLDFYEHVTAYKRLIIDRLQHKPPVIASDNLITWGLTHTWAGVGDSLPIEVTAICIGDDVAIVCLPGEVFVDLGLAIKRASPFRTTFVIELANAKETIYLPTRAACAQGSYEVTNSATQPGSGEMLVETAIGLLREAAAE
ncbi:MAG: hypothetical protein JNG89_06820 [Planctomycetaceae bacterium]|nr:hypothetical protein [Planctomycetaceae bacterium]